ncbi:hypothetical protein EFO05_13230 [Lactococcus lactis]|nr:hypothetical protein [Lactococcus lactis]
MKQDIQYLILQKMGIMDTMVFQVKMVSVLAILSLSMLAQFLVLVSLPVVGVPLFQQYQQVSIFGRAPHGNIQMVRQSRDISML